MTHVYHALDNDWAAMRNAVLEGADPNAHDPGRGMTMLHVAAQHGRLDDMLFLVEHGAAVESLNHRLSTPIHFAAWKGHVEAVKFLCEKGADPSHNNRYGLTPLHWCAQQNHVEVARCLLEHTGGDHSPKDPHGITPLMWAVAGQHHDVAELLLLHGAHISEKCIKGCTALNYVQDARMAQLLRSFYTHEEMQDVLSQVDGKGHTIFHYLRGSVAERDRIGMLYLEWGAELPAAEVTKDNKGTPAWRPTSGYIGAITYAQAASFLLGAHPVYGRDSVIYRLRIPREVLYMILHLAVYTTDPCPWSLRKECRRWSPTSAVRFTSRVPRPRIAQAPVACGDQMDQHEEVHVDP